MFYQVSLEDLVPKDNFYRKLGGGVKSSLLYKATAGYYGTEGQDR
ncbi:MAG: hypothetical protein R3A43_03300 [Bacteroidia bacterium]